MWVVKNTGCDVIVDDEEGSAMVVARSRTKKCLHNYSDITTRGSGLFSRPGVS